MSKEQTQEQALKEALEEIYLKTSYGDVVINISKLLRKHNVLLYSVMPYVLSELGIITRPSLKTCEWGYKGEIDLRLCSRIISRTRYYNTVRCQKYNMKVKAAKSEEVKIVNKLTHPFLPGDTVYTYESDRPYKIVSIESGIFVLESTGDSLPLRFFMAENIALQILSFKPYTLIDGGLCQEREIDYNSLVGKFCIFHDTGTSGFIDKYARFGSEDTYPHKSNNNAVGTENVTPLSEEDSKIIENIFNKYHV